MVTSLSRRTLARLIAAAGVVLGALMTIGGLGLVVALLSSAQPSSQVATAAVLLGAGVVILVNSRRILNQDSAAMRLAALATAIFLAYSGVALRDFGELFWGAVAFLLALLIWRPGTLSRASHPF